MSYHSAVASCVSHQTEQPIKIPPPLKRKDWEAMEAYDLAQFVLRDTGSYFPSLSEMKANQQVPDTPSGVKQRINQLQNQFTDSLEKLHQHHAEIFVDDAMDRWLQCDESQHDTNQTSFRLRQTFQGTSREDMYTRFNNDLNQIRVVQCKVLEPLLQRRKALDDQDESERRRRDAQFPKSVAEYDGIRNRDVQLRIARFLSSDRPQQEKMLQEFGWVWRQVQPLLDMYNSNADFKSDISRRVKDVEVRDPRRPSTMQLG